MLTPYILSDEGAGMTPKKGYALVPKELPSRRRGGLYQLMVAEFESGPHESVLVEVTDKQPFTLVQGLRKAIQANGITTIGVVQRGGKVYLVREV
jgi:hypothetical protein